MRKLILISSLLVCLNAAIVGQTASSPENQPPSSESSKEDSTATTDELLPEVEVRAERDRSFQRYVVEPDSTTSPDSADMMDQVPGGHSVSNGPVSGQTQYRGMFGPRMNTRVDGMYINPGGPNWMDPPMHYAPRFLVEDVEVTRGIAPVSSGAESIGGSVNVRTRGSEFADTESFQHSGTLNAMGRSADDGFSAGGLASSANNRYRAHVFGTTDNGGDREFPGGEIDATEHERHTYGAGVGHKFDRQTVSLNVQRTDTNESGNPQLPMDIQFIDTDFARLNYERTGTVYDVSGKLYVSGVDHKMDNFSLRPPPDFSTQFNPGPAFDGSDRRFVEATSEGIGFDLSATRDFLDGQLEVGLNVHQAQHNMDVFDPDSAFHVMPFNDVQRDRYSLFSEWTGSLTERWELEAGLRTTYVDMDAGEGDTDETIPNGGTTPPPLANLRDDFNQADRTCEDLLVDGVLTFSRSLGKSVELEIGLGRKTRAPSYIERFTWVPIEATAGLADNNNHVGDPDLDPEVSREIDLGVNWETTDDKLEVAPRVFYRDVEDYITGVPFDGSPNTVDSDVERVSRVNGDDDPLRFDNSEAEFYGADVNSTYQLTERISLFGVLSYVRGRNTEFNDDLWRIPPLNGRIGGTYREQHDESSWSITVESVFAARQDQISDIHVKSEADTTNDETPGYGIVNVRGNWSPLESVSLQAGINNLFDQSYRDHLSGFNRVAGSDVEQGERLPGTGRNVYISATVSF
jgi:iron complex outermembrane receptor protein